LSNITTITWPIEPHTKAKHEILRRYLGAWFPILSSWSGRIIYLDGFAGPGIYAGGEDGSPVVALKTAVDHPQRQKFKEIKFMFIEKDKDRANTLTEVLKQNFNLPKNITYNVIGGGFAPTFKEVLDELDVHDVKIAPTFAFIDPFGFSGLPMELIARLLNYNSCEVLITFMSGFVRRFHDELREEALSELYATEEWKKVDAYQTPEEREKFLLQLYEKQLRTRGGAKYVRSFGMIGQNNQTVYYLVYATKSLRGLDVMKDAMWKVDRTGQFKFSDVTGFNQSFLLDYADEPSWVLNAAKAIYEKFRGQTVQDQTIYDFIITETRFPKRKAPLNQLEKELKILKVNRPLGKNKGFPEGSTITFAP